MICNGCGGVVGRDCYNPIECEQITSQMNADSYADEVRRNYEEKLFKIYSELIESSTEVYSGLHRLKATRSEKIIEIFYKNGFAYSENNSSEFPF